jgi:hypothetical protein
MEIILFLMLQVLEHLQDALLLLVEVVVDQLNHQVQRVQVVLEVVVVKQQPQVVQEHQVKVMPAELAVQVMLE